MLGRAYQQAIPIIERAALPSRLALQAAGYGFIASDGKQDR